MLPESSLEQLYSNHAGKVSDKWLLYLKEYERLFNSYRNDAIHLLEVGVQNGGSLEIWSKYFPNAQKLVGCDINEKCRSLKYDHKNIFVLIGDIASAETKANILQLSNKYDIIIDDGSHTSPDVIKTFLLYFEALTDDGLYIVEDIHCSYWEEFDGGLYEHMSSISFFKRLVDIINFQHWGLDNPRVECIRGFTDHHGIPISEEQLTSIHSVEFIDSLCVIRKCKPDDNCLKERVISGKIENIVNLEDKCCYYEPIRQIASFTERVAMPIEEDWFRLNSELAETQNKVHTLNSELAETQDKVHTLNSELAETLDKVHILKSEIVAYKTSWAWKLTQPFRDVFNYFHKFRILFRKNHKNTH